MQPGAVLFLHLFYRTDLATEVGELSQLLLNGLEPFMSLAVSDLSLGSIPIGSTILLVRLLNVGDLFPEAPDFIPQNFEVIH